MADKLYTIKISDNESFKLLKHPSESLQYFILKIIALYLNYSKRLVSSPICKGENPDLYIPAEQYKYELWIEIGNMSQKKYNMALKKAAKIYLYTFKKIPQLKKYSPSRQFFSAFHVNIDYEKLSQTMKTANIDWNVEKENDKLTVNGIEGQITSLHN